MADPDLYIHPIKEPGEFLNYKAWLIEALQNFLSLLHKIQTDKTINRNLIAEFAEKLEQVKYWTKYYRNDDDLTQSEKDKLTPICDDISYLLNLPIDGTANGPSFFKALDHYNKDNKETFHTLLNFLTIKEASYLNEVLIPDVQFYIQDIKHLS